MRAVLLHTYDNSAPLTPGTSDTPTASAGQVLVNIAASSVNTDDVKIRAMGGAGGLAPETPAILGMDFAGTVEVVGEGVEGCAPGDEVDGCAGGLPGLPGALAEYIAADHRLITKKPTHLSMRQAAALPLVAITAYEGLARVGVGTGQKILVHGGSGGVGHVALQLARHRGAQVFATGGGAPQLELIEQLGAPGIYYKTIEVAEYVQQHTDGQGFDVVYDTVGDLNMLKSFDAIKLNGDVITTTTICEIDMTAAHLKGLTLHIVFMLIPMLHNVGRERHAEILRDVASIAETGALTPVLADQRFTLDQAQEAHDLLASGKAMGKIVIEH